MESLLSWLNLPLWPERGIYLWTVIIAGLAAFSAILFGINLRQRIGPRRKAPEPVTLEPAKQPPLELANLQGMGMRTEQQDAFGMSPLDRYGENGLLAVLCDGMGGMAAGGTIAAQTAAGLLGAFPWPEGEQALQWIWQHNRCRLTEGDKNRGTTSASPAPRGMRPHRVQQHPIAVTGEPDTFLIGPKLFRRLLRDVFSRRRLSPFHQTGVLFAGRLAGYFFPSSLLHMKLGTL